jgi:hypothetical protein
LVSLASDRGGRRKGGEGKIGSACRDGGGGSFFFFFWLGGEEKVGVWGCGGGGLNRQRRSAERCVLAPLARRRKLKAAGEDKFTKSRERLSRQNAPAEVL